MNRGGVSAALLVLLLFSACDAAQRGDGPATAHVLYGIRYTVGADAYDDREASAALRRCADLPGASLAGQDDSLPPQPSVRFQGTFTEQDRLEACLRGLPDAEVREPRPIPPDQR